MRITHVVSTYPPYRGGMGNVAHELVSRTAARGVDVHVITPASVSWKVRLGNAAWCPAMGRQLADTDIVHFHWPFIGGLAPVLRWKLRDPKRRLVVQYHMDLIGRGRRGVLFSVYECVALMRLFAHADRIVCSSDDYAWYGTLGPLWNTIADRGAVIPLGVDAERFAPSVSLAVRHSTLETLFVGGLDTAHAFKGVHVLLQAIAQTDNVSLRIVGDGNLRTQYEAQARALGVADRVVFLGAVSDEELPEVYRRADALVFPSTSQSEAFGLVALEAMACGKPVIASNLPGVRTVVRDGETGRIVPSNDIAALAQAIGWLRDHPDHRIVWGAAGRRAVEEHYAWARVVAEWMVLYKQLAL
ncbi:MAG: glycosyltransferase [bacterium]|nr:glycosyltransferase [bacterium]